MSKVKPENTKIKGENPKKSKPRKKKPPKKITPTYLHNAGLFYLQRFAASTQQFRTVMLRKVKKSCRFHTDQDYETCAEMVEETIKKFQEAGLLNDELYARGMVNSLRRQGKSQKAILYKLQTKGIAQDKTRETLHSYNDENNLDFKQAEMQAALVFARKKKLGPYSPAQAHTSHEKSLSAFARNGFSYDIAKTVLAISEDELQQIEN